ncbi:TIGR02285 family protein [Andreprevotia chitinilytica]|uniref:TIGR02285 family protein n=1 Tax=Andreprevotia chitinilytica TaxID=396808 RepID=UPI0005536825|nr:TIGR02285 family protein [Andreprevotia chitinilytica]
MNWPRILAGLIGLAASVINAAEREITWVLLPDRPPLYLLKADKTPETPAELGEGISDRAIMLVAAKLPQYRHRFIRADLQRMWGEIERGHNLCNISVLRTPDRGKFAYFTPSIVLPPLALVVRKDRLSQFNVGGKPASLTALIAKPELTGAFTAKRSYTTPVDALIDRPSDGARRVVDTSSGQLLRLIAAGSIDYTLEYPFIVAYHQKTQPFEHELALQAVPEIPDVFALNAICTRNAWGKQALQDIDAALIALSATETFRNITAPWMPADIQHKYRPRFDQFYNGHTQPIRLTD